MRQLRNRYILPNIQRVIGLGSLLLLCLLISDQLQAQQTRLVGPAKPGSTNKFAYPPQSIHGIAPGTNCCELLRFTTGNSDTYPVQLLDYGGYHYVLANTLLSGGSKYGMLIKYHTSGARVWSLRTDFPAEFTALTAGSGGTLVVAGKSSPGTNAQQSLFLQIDAGSGALLQRWVYDHGGADAFTAAALAPSATSTHDIRLAAAVPGTEDRVSFYHFDPGAGTASVARTIHLPQGNTVWHNLLPLEDGGTLGVGIVTLHNNLLQQRGVLVRLNASGGIEDVFVAPPYVRFTHAVAIPGGEGFVVAARHPNIDGSGPSNQAPTLWIFNDELVHRGGQQWKQGFSGFLTDLTLLTHDGQHVVYATGVGADDKGRILRLPLRCGGNLAIALPGMAALFSGASFPPGCNYSFIGGAQEAYRIDVTAAEVSEPRLRAARNGRYLLYAHGRRQTAGATQQLYSGILPLSLQLACLDSVAMSSEYVAPRSNEPLTLQSQYQALPTPTTAGNWSTASLSSPQRCTPQTITACDDPSPQPSWGYVSVPPIPNCSATDLNVRVVNALGQPVLPDRAYDPNQATLVDLTAFAAGIYFVHFVDSGDIVRHTVHLRKD